jgi:hypothetical protein
MVPGNVWVLVGEPGGHARGISASYVPHYLFDADLEGTRLGLESTRLRLEGTRLGLEGTRLRLEGTRLALEGTSWHQQIITIRDGPDLAAPGGLTY